MLLLPSPSQVLADRSTSRLSTGQRTSLNDIEDVRVVKKDGSTYVLYEHLSQVGTSHTRLGVPVVVPACLCWAQARLCTRAAVGTPWPQALQHECHGSDAARPPASLDHCLPAAPLRCIHRS